MIQVINYWITNCTTTDPFHFHPDVAIFFTIFLLFIKTIELFHLYEEKNLVETLVNGKIDNSTSLLCLHKKSEQF